MKGLYNYWFEIMVFLMIFPIVQFGVYLGFFLPLFLGRYLFILLSSLWVINAVDIAFKQLDIYLEQLGISTNEDIYEQIVNTALAYISSTGVEEIDDRR